MRRLQTIFPLILLSCLFPAMVRAAASDNAIVSRSATVEGVSLHYLTAGHGPMVVLVHGYAETSRMWRPIIPLLAERIHGDRARPARDWRLGRSRRTVWT